VTTAAQGVLQATGPMVSPGFGKGTLTYRPGQPRRHHRAIRGQFNSGR
jgi:hypothetical protein